MQQLSIDVAGIDDMLLRQQFFLLESFMNGGGCGVISDRSRSRFDMSDQVRAVFLAGFRQVDASTPTQLVVRFLL